MQLNLALADQAKLVICYQSIEQDHRAVKRLIRPMLGFQSFHSAQVTLQGIELLHLIKKGQRITVDGQGLAAAEQFYSLAA